MCPRRMAKVTAFGTGIPRHADSQGCPRLATISAADAPFIVRADERHATGQTRGASAGLCGGGRSDRQSCPFVGESPRSNPFREYRKDNRKRHTLSNYVYVM